MKYSEISPPLRLFVGACEGLRKLGFPSEDIWCQIGTSALNGQLSCFLVLKQGEKEFILDCGPVNTTSQKFHKEFLRVVSGVKEGILEEDLMRLWTESAIYKDPMGFLMAMHNKGIVIPKELPAIAEVLKQ